MDKMPNPQARRTFLSRPRPRVVLVVALASLTSYLLLFSGRAPQTHIVPYLRERPAPKHAAPADEKPLTGAANGPGSAAAGLVDEPTAKAEWHIDIDDIRYWTDPDDREDPKDALPGFETDGKTREAGDVARLKHEKDLRKIWRYVYKTTAELKSSNHIYGNTLDSLVLTHNRTSEHAAKLSLEQVEVGFSQDRAVRFNPYPDYNGDGWRNGGHAPHVPCKGLTGDHVEDLLVFRGRPQNWPAPKFGSYEVLNMDPNICWERETRLGPYGLTEQKKRVAGGYAVVDWENVNWGDLQQRCLKLNADRFDMDRSRENEYFSAYPETALRGRPYRRAADSQDAKTEMGSSRAKRSGEFVKERRTAVLLRSYTGMHYSENDKQIRALISELNLKTGGEYEVFLVHSKDKDRRIFDDDKTYHAVLRENVQPEFHGMTVLWNDEQVWSIYTELKDKKERSVTRRSGCRCKSSTTTTRSSTSSGTGRWTFASAATTTTSFLHNLGEFVKQQPRKYLWERNERWYIPDYHGDYDTAFRDDVARRHGDDTVWGPVRLPFINPVGPEPPVESHRDDDYELGVGEDADFISVGPIFDPVDSQWIISKHVWGFKDSGHRSEDLPRRTTIVTQSRVSRRLLDIMHVENLRGNHVASEMTPQTMALLHGFKAVYAPHPVFMDRDWRGGFLNKWFNPGPSGECGGRGSPMGWGRERRYQGTTWYYRAEPPNRLYNNWMSWADTDLGGQKWEEQHGHPCLPSVMLHQVKKTEPTERDHKTGFDLPYG